MSKYVKISSDNWKTREYYRSSNTLKLLYHLLYENPSFGEVFKKASIALNLTENAIDDAYAEMVNAEIIIRLENEEEE